MPSEALPEANAILNPNLSDCKFQSKNLCGVGVVFYLMLSVRAKLKELGYFDNKIRYPNLGSYLDLLALGTVADVVKSDPPGKIVCDVVIPVPFNPLMSSSNKSSALFPVAFTDPLIVLPDSVLECTDVHK